MRLSLSQTVQNSLLHISNASLKLSQAQERTASGKRILRASDDVPGTDRALSLRSAISTLNQLTDNTTVSKPLLELTDRALGEMVTAIEAVRDKALAAATSVVDNTVREGYVKQIDGILQEMLDVANTRYMDQHIFSGTATDAPAVIQQVGPPQYAYNGNAGLKRTQILQGVSIALNVTGERAFNFDGGAGPGTTDVFTMVTQVRDAIRAGDVDTISAHIEDLDRNLDNLLSCRSTVGSWIQRIERAQGVLEDTKLRLGELLSDEENVDLPQAVIDLKTQENVYQAALAVSSRILDLSLASLQFK